MTQESNADASGISTCTLAPPRRTIFTALPAPDTFHGKATSHKSHTDFPS